MERSPIIDFFKRSFLSAAPQSTAQRRRARRAQQSSGCDRHRFVLEGILQYGRDTMFSINGTDMFSIISINGTDITITDDTWLFGDLEIGEKARARGLLVDEDRYLCVSVLVNPGPMRNSSTC